MLFVSPLLYSMVALVNLARSSRPASTDQAGLLSFYGSVMPPEYCYLLCAAGFATSLITLLQLLKKRKGAEPPGGHEAALFGPLAIATSALFGLGSLIGSYLILTAKNEHSWVCGVHFAFSAILSFSTLLVGIPMSFLSAFFDRNDKLFLPAILVTFFCALAVGAINIYFSRTNPVL